MAEIFIGKTAIGFGGLLAMSHILALLSAEESHAAINIPIGFQTYPIKLVEMCSPPGYTDGVWLLMNMKTADIKSIITDAGLTCLSCPFGFEELTDKVDDRIELPMSLAFHK